MHNFAMIAMENFLKNMTRESVPIDQQINNLLQQQIKKTRNSEIPFKNNNFLRKKNNIALRGPRDDDPQNASLSGNFQELLEFRIDSGDQRLQTAPANCTWKLHPEMQHTFLKPLTVRLQKKAMDLLKAKEEIVLLKSALTGMQTA